MSCLVSCDRQNTCLLSAVLNYSMFYFLNLWKISRTRYKYQHIPITLGYQYKFVKSAEKQDTKPVVKTSVLSSFVFSKEDSFVMSFITSHFGTSSFSHYFFCFSRTLEDVPWNSGSVRWTVVFLSPACRHRWGVVQDVSSRKLLLLLQSVTLLRDSEPVLESRLRELRLNRKKENLKNRTYESIF